MSNNLNDEKTPNFLGKKQEGIVKNKFATACNKAAPIFEDAGVEPIREGASTMIATCENDLHKVAKQIRRVAENQTQVENFSREFDCFPLDGALALQRALSRAFGMVAYESVHTMFGEIRPEMIQVKLSGGKQVRVPWGVMSVAGISGKIKTYAGSNKPQFILSGEVEHRDMNKMSELANMVEEELNTGSIYKGRAIEVSFPWLREPDCNFNVREHQPKFLETGKIHLKDVVVNKYVRDSLLANLWSLIQKPNTCRANGVNGKRGIALSGAPGTGKTMTATALASTCVENGWSFILLTSASDVPYALELARTQIMQPCVVFCEDFDTALESIRSEAEFKALCEAIDGMQTKDSNTIFVYSTNHFERMPAVLVRHGRTSANIVFDYPDGDTVHRLIKLAGGDLLEEGADFSKVAEKLAENNVAQATVVELIDRAKLYSIANIKEDTGELVRITPDAIDGAWEEEKRQQLLHKPMGRTPSKPIGGLAIPIPSDIGRIINDIINRPPDDGSDE